MRRRTAVAPVLPIVLAAVALTSCTSDVRLLDERRTPPYAGLLARGEALSQRSAFVRAEDPGAPALVMHLRETHAPAGADRPLIVLQPGVMADHRTFRFLAPLLGERYDLLLVDPPGTGQSDKPDPGAAGPEAYTPAWLGRHTLRAVDAWLARRDDRRRVVLLGHSLGATALVRALAEPATRRALPDLLARIEALVLLTPADVGMERVDPQFETIVRLGDAEASVGGVLGVIRARIEDGVYESVEHPERRALRQEACRLTAIVVHHATRRPMQAMLRRFRPLTPGQQPAWPAIRAQIARHATVDVRALVLWGTEDDTLPVTMAPRVAAQLPNARVVEIEDAKHSVHQEQPAAAFEQIVRFLDERR